MATAAAVLGALLALAYVFAPALPQLDVADLAALRDPARRAEARERVEAAAAVGVFRVTGHGLDLARVRAAGRAYFELPLEVRACEGCSKRDPAVGMQRGFIPFAGESGLAEFTEAKEGFIYGYDYREASGNPHQVPNVWPADPVYSGWRADLDGFFANSVVLARSLVRALEDVARAPELNLTGGETISQMRMFHYLPSSDPKGIGSSPHSDWHAITLIVRDDASQLQFFDGTRWRDATPGPSDVVALVGDYLSLSTKGYFPSRLHRVLLPTTFQPTPSFVFFFYPSWNARLERFDLQAVTEKANTVSDRIFQMPWGPYMSEKWGEVMSNAA